MNDRISIVVPTRNRVSLLRQALRCAAAQSWRDTEIVVVDEASTDGTAGMVAREFAGATVIRHDTPRGPAGARNAGVARCDGRWVLFWDDDDLMHPGHLEALMQAARLAPARCLVSGRVRSFAFVDGRLWLAPVVCAPPDRPAMATLADILHPLGRNDFTLSTVLWPRALFEEVRWDESLAINEDVDLFGQVLLAGWQIVGRPVGLHYIRQHGGPRVSTDPALGARLSPARYRMKWSDLLAYHPERQVCAAALRDGFMALLLDLDGRPEARDLMPLLRDHFRRWGGGRYYVFPPPRHWLKRAIAQVMLAVGGPRGLRRLLAWTSRPAPVGEVLEARFRLPSTAADRADAAFIKGHA